METNEVSAFLRNGLISILKREGIFSTIDQKTFIDVLNYNVAEEHRLNMPAYGGYTSRLSFMGCKFYTHTDLPITNIFE